MQKRLRMNLQLFAEETPGAESVPAAEEQATPQAASESGAETPVAAEPEKHNNFEKAFAKRLADAKASWEAEAAEKFKGYEDYKYLATYLQEANGMDVLTLKEQIELERLQERAAKEQVPPSVLKRLDELEAKAAKGDELEQQIAEEKRVNSYFDALNSFVKDKGVESDRLNQFMIDNHIPYDPNNMEKSFSIAYKAMIADDLQAKLENAEKDGVKKFLQAKSAIPTVTGASAQGQVSSAAPKTFAEARARAMQRFTSN